MDKKQKFSVLIADDDSVIRDTLKDMLTGMVDSIGIYEAENGADACIKIKNQLFDIVITDYKMPKQDGSHVFKYISTLSLEKRPRYIVLFSGYIDPNGSFGKFKNVKVLVKPASKESVRQSLLSILEELKAPLINDTTPPKALEGSCG